MSSDRLLGCCFDAISGTLREGVTISFSSIFADDFTCMAGKLNLVDLAGSERVSQSGADGTRLKEAQKHQQVAVMYMVTSYMHFEPDKTMCHTGTQN